jgi:hypothetical protein
MIWVKFLQRKKPKAQLPKAQLFERVGFNFSIVKS